MTWLVNNRQLQSVASCNRYGRNQLSLPDKQLNMYLFEINFYQYHKRFGNLSIDHKSEMCSLSICAYRSGQSRASLFMANCLCVLQFKSQSAYATKFCKQILIASCLSYVNCGSNKWHANFTEKKRMNWQTREEMKQRLWQGRCQMREMQMNEQDELLNNSTGCDDAAKGAGELIGFD